MDLIQSQIFHCCKLNRGRRSKFFNIYNYLVSSEIIFYSCRSADHILDVSNNIITTFKQLNPTDKQHAPIILNCISGGTERSGLITLGISAILATQMKKPNLLSKFLKLVCKLKIKYFCSF